jgi:hypothetical protein
MQNQPPMHPPPAYNSYDVQTTYQPHAEGTVPAVPSAGPPMPGGVPQAAGPGAVPAVPQAGGAPGQPSSSGFRLPFTGWAEQQTLESLTRSYPEPCVDRILCCPPSCPSQRPRPSLAFSARSATKEMQEQGSQQVRHALDTTFCAKTLHQASSFTCIHTRCTRFASAQALLKQGHLADQMMDTLGPPSTSSTSKEDLRPLKLVHHHRTTGHCWPLTGTANASCALDNLRTGCTH